MKKNKQSFFYNHSSQEVIHASCEYYKFAEWGMKNATVFCLDTNHKIHTLNVNTDSKMFERVIYNEGWSYVNIENEYCIIEALNFETGKKVLNIVAKENNIESACLKLGDVNAVFLEKDDIQGFLNTGELGNHLFNDHLEKNLELNELIKELKLFNFSEQIFVFGSINKGKIAPPDLDIWIDATEISINIEDKNKILTLVEKYSLRLDPYIRTKNSILAVDSNIFTYEFNWIDLGTTNKSHIVQHFKKWEKDAKEGVPLNDLKLLPSTIEELLNNISPIKKIKIKL